MVEDEVYVMLMMMRADDSYSPSTVEGCTAEELLKCITADDYDACIAACSGEPENPDEPTNPGYATVSTKAASTQTVALNAVEKKIGTVTLKAGENDTTVTALEITKSGLGDVDDILSIQLMKNGEYVSNSAHLNKSKRTASLRFSPKLTIKAGKSETFDVVVSLAGNDNQRPNGQHDFSVTAVTVVNGSFGGTPAKLGSLVTTNYLVGKVTTEISAGTNNLDAGDENKDIVLLTLTPDVDAEISSVTITSNKEELNKTFANVKAYVNDEEAGTVTVYDETMTISGLKETVKKGKKLDIVVKGDVIYAGKDLNLTLTVEDNHVYAIETNTDERMASVSDEDHASAVLTIAGVDVTLTNLVKKSQTVAPGTTDVVLMDLELTAGTDLEITDFAVLMPSAFPFAQFEETGVTLYVDGVDYAVTGAELRLGAKKADHFTVSAGDKVSIQVKGDAKDTISGSVKDLQFAIYEVKNLENNNVITASGEDATIADEKSHKTTFSAGEVTIKNTLKTANNLIEEGETSTVLGFSIEASNEKLRVNSMEFEVAGYKTGDAEDGRTEIVNKVELFKKGSNSAIKSVKYKDIDDDNGTVLMENLGQSINADDTVEYELRVTLNDGSVDVLGAPVTFKLAEVNYKNDSSSTGARDEGITKEYSISSTKPTFSISKNGNKITVVITNGSEYDLNLDGFMLQVIGNVNDNGNNPFENALAASGTWKLQDTAGNNLSDYGSRYEDNVAAFSFADETIKAGKTETYVVVMPQKASIKSEYYEAEERFVVFTYSNKDGESQSIEAEYNGGVDDETLPEVVVEEEEFDPENATQGECEEAEGYTWNGGETTYNPVSTEYQGNTTYYTRSGEEGNYTYTEAEGLTEFEDGVTYYTATVVEGSCVAE